MRNLGSFKGIGLIGALMLVIGVGCGKASNEAAGKRAQAAAGSAAATFAGGYPIRVVTTCGMVTDIVRQVAGERGEVIGLMGEGVDPHLYKPTRNDVRELLEADIIFYVGLMLEGRMTDTFVRVGRQGKPVFSVTEEIDPALLREPPEFEGHADPHVWMDVAAWSECVAMVAKTLARFDPAGATVYEENARAYREELKTLDEYAKRVIGSIPEQGRVLVTAHDAFGYFSRAYGIPVKAVQGISTESEAGVDDVVRLVQYIVDNQIKAIFVESSVSGKNIQAVIEGAAKQGWEVRIGGELYSDAMGQAGTYEGTYLGMIDHNATTIARALGGTAPERGFSGKLTPAHE